MYSELLPSPDMWNVDVCEMDRNKIKKILSYFYVLAISFSCLCFICVSLGILEDEWQGLKILFLSPFWLLKSEKKSTTKKIIAQVTCLKKRQSDDLSGQRNSHKVSHFFNIFLWYN